MKFLILDNYDSFVYNLAQIFGEFGVTLDVVRNDKITIKQIKVLKYDAIIISPGPGTVYNKKYFGICGDVISKLSSYVPILGICLGHQGIIKCFGGEISNTDNIRHGKISYIRYYDDPLFDDIINPFSATRYHSLVGTKSTIPDSLKVIAISNDDEEIMGITHKKFLVKGMQFHPESIMTTQGKKILKNFLRLIKK